MTEAVTPWTTRTPVLLKLSGQTAIRVGDYVQLCQARLLFERNVCGSDRRIDDCSSWIHCYGAMPVGTGHCTHADRGTIE